MRLDFETKVANDPLFCALINESGRRIEFHLAEVDNLVYMVALSGRFGHPATRQKAQGPFFTIAQASGAMKAICNSLVRTGYEQLIGTKPHWTFQVRGELKRIREEKDKFKGNYAFNPNDVYFE